MSDTSDPLVPEYAQFVTHKMADVAKAALEDLKPAKMGYGIGQAPNVASSPPGTATASPAMQPRSRRTAACRPTPA